MFKPLSSKQKKKKLNRLKGSMIDTINSETRSLINTMFDNEQNSCGECNLCCKLPEISEMQKPSLKTCQYLINEKCSVYNTRPKVCQNFYCGYRNIKKLNNEKYRPDKCGLYIFASNSHIKDNISGKKVAKFITINIWETYYNAFMENEKILKEVVDTLWKEGCMVIMREYSVWGSKEEEIEYIPHPQIKFLFFAQRKDNKISLI